MIVAGIDSGLSGALAVIEESGYCETCDMPVTEYGKKTFVDSSAVWRWLDERGVEFAVIEHAQAMPKQGVTGVFTYGQAFGQVLSVVQLLGPHMLVKPQLWKRQMGLIKAGKTASRDLASKKFPLAAWQFQRVKDHGRAEAALIAHWFLHHRSPRRPKH